MTDYAAVLEAVGTYCKGVYLGDLDLLRSVFHPKAALFAEVRGQPYYKPLEEYLAVVATRASPEARGEPFMMTPLALEVTHEIAFAKVHCPMLGYNYTDYLSLVREEGRWRIVNKLFTDVPYQENRPCKPQIVSFTRIGMALPSSRSTGPMHSMPSTSPCCSVSDNCSTKCAGVTRSGP